MAIVPVGDASACPADIRGRRPSGVVAYHPAGVDVSQTVTGTQARWILLAVILASGIVFLDSTIVNVALPTIAADLPATQVGTLEGQAYVTSGYLATLSAFLIIAGALADRYGRRRIFIIGLASFGLASALCGLAPTMEWLIVFRLFQGAAGALLVPGPLSLITANFEGEARARAFGLWSAATAALTIMGPLVGGIIVDSFSWRLAFLVNVPLVLLALYAAIRHVPESRNQDAPRRLDWLGSIVIAVAVGGITFGLIRGQEQRWTDPAAFIALGIGIAAAVAFPILMVRRRDPLVPPALFRIRAFAVINASTFLIYGALYTYSFLMSVFLQGVLGYTRAGRRSRGPADGHPADAVLDPGGHRRGPDRARGASWSSGRCSWPPAWPGSSRIAADSTPWLLDLGRASCVPPTRRVRGRAAGGPPVRRRHHPRRGAPDDHAHGFGAGRQRRPRVGHQQRGVTGGLAAAAGDAVHRHHGRVLRLAGQAGALAWIPARTAVRAAVQPLNPPPAGTDPIDGRRHRPGLDRCVPARDAGRRGAAAGGRRGQRVGPPPRTTRATRYRAARRSRDAGLTPLADAQNQSTSAGRRRRYPSRNAATTRSAKSGRARRRTSAGSRPARPAAPWRCRRRRPAAGRRARCRGP